MAISVPIVSQWNPKGVNSASKDLSNLQKVGKQLGATFAGVFAARKVAQFFTSSIQGALEDQKAQIQLAKSIQNSTNATNIQIASLEKYITATQFATGVSDAQLRPALNRLVLATSDVTKSQEFLNLALDVSAGTGKDLEAVTTALSKAAGGQYTALQRLGVGLNKAVFETKDLDTITGALRDKFQGQAAAAADTYAGKVQILSRRVNEATEEIGYGLITALEILAGPNGSIDVAGNAITKFGDDVAALIVGTADLTRQMYELAESFIANAQASGYLPQNLMKLVQAIPVVGGVAAALLELRDRGREVIATEEQNALTTQLSADRYTQLAKTLGYAFPKQKEYSGAVKETKDRVKELNEAIKQAIQKNIDFQESIVSNLEKSLNSAESSLADAKNKFDEFKSAISDSVVGVVDFAAALETGEFLKTLTKQADSATVFADRLKTLIGLGLSESAIRQVLAAGYEAGTLIADQLIEGGKTVIDQVNTLVASVESVANTVGELGAQTFYQAGVTQGEALVAGIKASLEAARAELERLRASLTAVGTTTKGATGNGSANINGGTILPPDETGRYGLNRFSRLANGGIAMGPTFALIGEAGPEAVVPLSKAGGGMGGSTFNIVVNAGIGTNGAQVGAQIVEAITKYEKQSGQVFVRS